MSEKRENGGILFKNDRKEKDTHPDMKGFLDVGGVEYEIAAWSRTGQKGKFLSLSVKPKQERAEPRRPAERPRAEVDDDDLPF